MVSRTCRQAICKYGMMVLLMAVVALWARAAIAGVNEDLIEAAKRGDLQEVSHLLDKGADVNAKNNEGASALFLAALKGHIEIVHALLDKGADVNAKSNKGGTALMVASLNGYGEIVQALLVRVPTSMPKTMAAKPR